MPILKPESIPFGKMLVHLKAAFLGSGVSTSFNLTSDKGIVQPSSCSSVELLEGVPLIVDDSAAFVYIDSINGSCPLNRQTVLISFADCYGGESSPNPTPNPTTTPTPNPTTTPTPNPTTTPTPTPTEYCAIQVKFTAQVLCPPPIF